MASLARYGDTDAARSDASSARRFRADAEGLAAFRLLADVECERSLSALIESEIIPRLMIAHASGLPDAPTTDGRATIDAVEIADLAPLALMVEADALLAHVEAILARGVSVETVMVDLLAPTARLLGEYWEDDRCDFVEVTMGLWRLQEVVHEIAARSPGNRPVAPGGRRALFASMPGDQHNFGTVVIDELFRRDGWTTDRMSDAATPDLLKRVGESWFDMIGLTISCDCHIAGLTSVIGAMRNVSKNPRVCIMVGGRIFSADPDLAAHVGADGTAQDARLALKVAADLVRAREGDILTV
ncbi:cobalamin B12-binding domain-containing protein [Sphingomonas mollis]|uniref:Cobalamin B12-binding domain-containing protein n=1 Tax=Sphingomonas mollis TaxID=2795726 RepID=A0ABS0XSF2_9SPHN|nr:cobalamin B12-binding domain-containing protein [Sphingomonas sp. BT553]MBJ6122980.1 cobalamin B12-binding domain-containing protein [Sphingomonas sp. BT553]